MTDPNTTISDDTRNQWEQAGRNFTARQKPQAWWKKPVVILPLGTLVLGLSLGTMNRPDPVTVTVEKPVEKIVEKKVTPVACLTALDLSEQAFGYAAESMGYMSKALTAAGDMDVAAITQASADLKVVTPKMEALSPRVNAAKAECRAAGS